MKRVLPRGVLWATSLLVSLSAVPSEAVGTRQFVLRTGKDFEGGDLKGVAVDSVGQVRAGFNLGNTELKDATAVWSVLPLADGSVLVGTGNDGKLLRVQGPSVTVAAETKALVVTSLVEAWGGTVVLGTLPEGRVMKFERGAISDLVRLKATEHVWQVAYDQKNKVLYAGTGPEGKLWRITANGDAQVYFDAEEQHLMSVAVASDGTVYAGASDKAKLYKVTGPGRATVLYDFGRTEVRGIAVGARGDVYAIANEMPASPSPPKSSGKQKGENPAGPATRSPGVKGKGTLYHFSPAGTPDELLADSKQHFVSLALGDDGRPYVGTGVEGQIYTVDEQHNSVLVADTEERQVGALALTGKARVVACSDPAQLHPIRGIGGADAVWTSKVLDAGIRAGFGRMTWDSTGRLELSTRTGNTADPDSSWSEWSAPLTAPGAVTSPMARFLQVRARFNLDPDAVLREVEIPFLTDNLRAIITSVEAESSAVAAGSNEGVAKSGAPIDSTPDGKVKLSWNVNNPDADELRYLLEFRLAGTDSWFSLLEPHEKLTKESYEWEVQDLPEGRYRVRVTATDELSNPPPRATRHQLVSNLIVVDNTAPIIEGLKVTGRRVSGRVVDGVGPVARIEVSRVGTDEWYPYFPTDGIFDEQREEFDADVSHVAAAGPTLLSVRAYDRAGNRSLRSVMLR